MDAMKLLKDDHDKVKKLLGELESTTERGVKTRQELFAKVKQELVVHEAIEEEIFYPALKDHPKSGRSRSRPTRSTTLWTRSWPRSRVCRSTTRPGREVHRDEGERRASHR
jgi:hypothetical protein